MDRSVRLWTDPSPSAAVKAERGEMAEIVNRVCDAGSFKELGREDEPKVRLPISTYHRMRGEMAADPERAEEIEGAYYASERKRRDDLKTAGEARRVEIADIEALDFLRIGRTVFALAAHVSEAGSGRSAPSALHERTRKAKARTGTEFMAYTMTDRPPGGPAIDVDTTREEPHG